MSQLKLTLRPPPNVDFVHGYPGIPPGSDRVQAAVKGAIEVRVPPSGVKAKWVRIELRKVETLPGGGQTNTFYDFVGPSPVNLWTSPDDYSILRTQDFPFSIRIPESIPPSIALENRAGIQYELVASVCTKGKRSWFRKRKTVVVSEVSPVIIDKHELHSTWPVYCQPETRQLAQDGVTLIIERNHTCYGPGDRISLVATLKSDNLHTVILRGFEMTLKESTVFRASAFGAARRAAPQTKVLGISETKVAINATLYGGTLHKAELSCQLPPNHTTTTLNAARHIDVTYVLSVKALMGTGTHVTMDLPVIISNWQRYVSQEAIRRIGPAPSLSLLPPAPTSSSSPMMSIQHSNNPRSPQSATASTLPISPTNRIPPSTQYGSLPTSTTRASATSPLADELGYGIGYGKTGTHRQVSASKGIPEEAMVPSRPVAATSPTNPTSPGRRPNSANRFTITNAEPDFSDDRPATGSSVTAISPARSTGGAQQQKQWLTAKEEKEAYETARAKVEKSNGVSGASALSPTTSLSKNRPTSPTSSTKPWLTAEEEKALYEKAQAAVHKAQRQAPDGRSGGGGGSTSSHQPTPAELYQNAMASVTANAGKNQLPTPHVSPLSGGTPSRRTQQAADKVPHYLTAEQEKAALRRYEEAKMAVDRLHSSGYSESSSPGPIAYDSLYPKAGGSSTPSTDPPPPPFEASVSAAAASTPMSALAEKERLRRTYEAQDSAGGGDQVQSDHDTNAPPPDFDAAVSSDAGAAAAAAAAPISQQYMDAAAEKDALRKKLELRDAQAAARKKVSSQQQQQQQPARGGSPGVGQRPTPTPPVASGAPKILTAAEEKALMKAKIQAKDAKAQKKLNGHVNKVAGGGAQTTATPTTPTVAATAPSSPQLAFHPQPQQQHRQSLPATAFSSPPPPPPLMPRPPAEYIQETQEEDARVSKFAIDGASVRLEEGEEDDEVSSGMFVNGTAIRVPGPPPPLPPKPVGE